MKKTILAFTLLALGASAYAGSSSHYVAIAENEAVQALEKDLREKGFELMSITDTGNRYRCPCWDYELTFKYQDDGEVKPDVVAKVSVSGFGDRVSVSIKNQ